MGKAGQKLQPKLTLWKFRGPGHKSIFASGGQAAPDTRHVSQLFNRTELKLFIM